MQIRANGYYWVKTPDSDIIRSGWLIGEWTGATYGGFWELTGVEIEFADTDFLEIDPVPIERLT
jgi:hypothetical protein